MFFQILGGAISALMMLPRSLSNIGQPCVDHATSSGPSSSSIPMGGNRTAFFKSTLLTP